MCKGLSSDSLRGVNEHLGGLGRVFQSCAQLFRFFSLSERMRGHPYRYEELTGPIEDAE